METEQFFSADDSRFDAQVARWKSRKPLRPSRFSVFRYLSWGAALLSHASDRPKSAQENYNAIVW